MALLARLSELCAVFGPSGALAADSPTAHGAKAKPLGFELSALCFDTLDHLLRLGLQVRADVENASRSKRPLCSARPPFWQCDARRRVYDAPVCPLPIISTAERLTSPRHDAHSPL